MRRSVVFLAISYMSFFSYLFGSSSDRYSDQQKTLSEQTIQDIVSRSLVNTLSKQEELVVERAIATARKGNGKISLRQIDETLRRLQHAKDPNQRISEHDRRKLMKVFENYYAKLA